MWPFKPKQPEPKPKQPADLYTMLDGMAGDTAAALREYNEQNAVPVQAPMPDGVAMDSACSPVIPLSYDSVNPVLFAHFVSTGQFIGYPALAVIAQNWLVRKGCEAKPRDAVRKGWDIAIDGGELTPEQITAIERMDRRYQLRNNMIEAVTMNNVFGIRHVMFKHTNPDFDYSKPFNPDEFLNGGYAGISQIDPMRTTPELRNEDLTDPSSMTYLEPTWWWIGGKKVHKSHLVVLKGDMVPDLLKPTYRYGGVSVVQKVYERVYAAERTANEAPQLAMTKRLTWRKADLDKVAAKPGVFAKAMQKLTEFRNNYGVQLIGKDEEMGQMDTALTDLQQVIMGQYQLVCSILDVPASRLLGTGHQGFSTGDADIDYYIEELEELQGNDMTDVILAHYQRLIPSMSRDLGIDPSASVYPEWRAMRVMSDAEIADVNLKNRQADQIAWSMQAVSNEEIRDRMIADRFSGYEGLEPLDDTEEEELMQDGQEAEENPADGQA